MKKFIIGLLACIMTSFMVFSGCDVALENSPKTQSNMNVNGNVLVYDNYIYFANAYKSYETLSGNQNDTGKVTNESMKRIALTNGAISYDEDTSLPQNIENVVSKVVGFENSLMYSVGDNIIFASPNTHKDKTMSDRFEYNSYFTIKTDGTGLREFYTTNTTVSQQAIYCVDGKYYLFIVDVDINDDKSTTNKLVRIELGNNIGKAQTLVTGFNEIVFAENYNEAGDIYAYYTTAKTQNNTTLSDRTLVSQINMLTGKTVEVSTIEDSKSFTFKLVKYGKLYFTMIDNSSTFYYEYTPSNDSSNFSAKQAITVGVQNITINDFDVTKNQNNATYFIFQDDSQVYSLAKGDYNFAGNILINKSVTLLFVDVDYVYYSTDDGIYRTSVLDKTEQTISTQANFKTENIAFDGQYIYFYAQSDNNSTDTYYMYRASTKSAELGIENVELLSQLQDADQPDEDEE